MLWLVTGCSSGLGLALVEAILAIPDQKVIATSRTTPSPSSALQQILSNPNVFWESLDVSSLELERQLATIISKHKHIDVLINNAGYAIGGAFENLPLEMIRQQFETNVFGPIRTMHAIAPLMRERKAGTIVNITSAVVWDPHPGTSAYSSSKWALDGLSQSVAAELDSFGVRMLIVQPGSLRTRFIDPKRADDSIVPLPEAYKGTMTDYVVQAIMSAHGSQKLDPKLCSEAIIKEVMEPTPVGEGKLLRLPLGDDCVAYLEGQLGKVNKDLSAVRKVALGCNFEDLGF